MGRTIAEAWKEEARNEEAVRTRRTVLLDQLRERFGKLPEETVAAIKSSKSIEDLDSWLRRVVKAATLKEIGIGG